MKTCECVMRSNGYTDPACKICYGEGYVDGSAAEGVFWACVLIGSAVIAAYLLHGAYKTVTR